jgi:leucyl-tRNA synthetase
MLSDLAAKAVAALASFAHSYPPGYIDLMAYHFTAIEKKWQDYWLQNATFRAKDPAQAADMPKSYVLDMFPYPSGDGLHVGHVIQQTATDIICRYLRAKGHNVLHPMGWDAFGLPAEQYAIKNNQHPAITTRKNIERFRSQIQALGMSYDWDRQVDTTDPNYYRWTQWIFLQLFNSYFDPIDQKAKPIAHLVNELQNENLVVAPDGSIRLNPTQEGMEAISGEMRIERLWRELSEDEQRDVLAGQRLAYMDEIPVNWCPGLGTVLANEEVIDGKSEVGGFPVIKQPMRQWMLRITACAERLLSDLNPLEWPESLKEMQRNWIGKSVGVEIEFDIDGNEDDEITVFTTRPDTLYGATYMVLSPEHPLVETITTPDNRPAVDAYRQSVAGKSERDRMADTKDKTGVFTGAHAINPINDEKIPIWIADYVLMGYGTGAIMAVPAHDERDFAFAKKFGLPIKAVVMPSDDWLKVHLAGLLLAQMGDPAQVRVHNTSIRNNNVTSETVTMIEHAQRTNQNPQEALEATRRRMAQAAELAVQINQDESKIDGIRKEYANDPSQWNAVFTGQGLAINSPVINHLPTDQAKEHMIEVLHAEGVGHRKVNYKLRDWLFSRQRYWGEPFPIILDATGNAWAVDENDLPVTLPEMADFKPTGTPEPPLSKARDWVNQTLNGKPAARETNTMPQWAGSCWYYLRYIDPKNPDCFVDPEKEKYWMPVDLYVGGAEHAVLHLLYSRFWHKVLFDRGYVSTVEPFQKLVNQGMILGEAELTRFRTTSGSDVPTDEIATGPEGGEVWSKTKEAALPTKMNPAEWEREGDDYVRRVGGPGESPGYRLPQRMVVQRTYKMSKSRGNVINPDSVVADYGADALRLYEMFMGPLEATKPWSMSGVEGISRFLARVWRMIVDERADDICLSSAVRDVAPTAEQLRILHRTIKAVTDDFEKMSFNTAISRLMEFTNEISPADPRPRSVLEPFVLLVSPLAPHLAEELWQILGHSSTLAYEPWPAFDESLIAESEIEIPVQVNGKLRGKVRVPVDADQAAVESAARADSAVAGYLSGKAVVKVVFVPGRLLNFVIK